jgi:hypothetical protein
MAAKGGSSGSSRYRALAPRNDPLLPADADIAQILAYRAEKSSQGTPAPAPKPASALSAVLGSVDVMAMANRTIGQRNK